MTGTDDLLGVDALVERIVAGVRPLPDFPLPLMDAYSMAVAEDVVAQQPLPHIDTSAREGYAVRHADVAEASEAAPVVLPVVGEVGLGRANHLALSPGTALRIDAGAPLPTGADGVVPLAWTDEGVVRVSVSRPVQVGQHVLRAGADVAVGDVVLEQGTVLGARHVGLLASMGRSQVRSRPRPRVVVMSTGAQLRDPGAALSHDSVHDGNSYLIAAAARAAGATAYRVGIAPDNVREFSEALSDQLVRADLVITVGGASEGGYDVVRSALGASGRGGAGAGAADAAGNVWFGSVAMDPGPSQGFGHVGEDQIPIFCLPGDPVAAYLSFQTFVLPALRTMMGKAPIARPTTRARLTHPIPSEIGVRQFVVGTYSNDRMGVRFTPVGSAGAQLVGDLAVADAVAVVGEETAGVPAGEMVDVFLIDAEF